MAEILVVLHTVETTKRHWVLFFFQSHTSNGDEGSFPRSLVLCWVFNIVHTLVSP